MAYNNQPSNNHQVYEGYQPPNIFYHQPPPPKTNLIRRNLGAISTVFMIICAIILIIWLAFRPHIPHFGVNSFSISAPFDLANNHLTTSWDASFSVNNPNKQSNAHFDEMQGAVIYNGVWLGYLSASPFVQGPQSESLRNASFIASNMFLDTNDVKAMNEERERNNETLSFDILVLADVRFKLGIWRVRRKLLKVYCEGLVISVDGNGTLSNGFSRGPKPCSVG